MVPTLCRPAARATLTALALTVTAVMSPRDQAIAQTAPVYELRRVIDVQIKPDSVAAWTKLYREEILPAQKKGGVPWLDAWASTTAGNIYMRTIVSPLAGLAELDDIGALQRALGPEAAEDLLARNRLLIDGIQTYILRVRPDLGFGTPPTAQGIGVISAVSVMPGRTAEFETALKESVLESLKEANVTSFAVLQNVFGGDPNQYRTVLAFQTHEAASSAHAVDPIAWLEGAHGPYGVERLAKEKGSPIAKIERTIIRYVPDLSYRPAAPTAGPAR